MGARDPLPELLSLGTNLAHARVERGLSQTELAARCGLAQQQVSLFEAGQRLPTLEQGLRLAQALDVSLQRLIAGADRPGTAIKDLAVELRSFGVADLRVRHAATPGAFRRPEEVIALAVSEREPDPRIIEALPAVLAWTEIHPILLKAYGVTTRTIPRLAWLADVALAIERRTGFPGGCRKRQLERFLKAVALPPPETAWDSLGKPLAGDPASPLWRRWKISYDATAEGFAARAASLAALGGGLPESSGSSPPRLPRTAAQRRAPAEQNGDVPGASQAPAPRRSRLRLKQGAAKTAPPKGGTDGR